MVPSPKSARTTPLAITGGATSATSGFAQSASGDSSDNTLYVRHANVYLGTDKMGFIRVGTGIAAMTLFETGLSDNFDIGGWISFASTTVPGNMAPVWPWADEGGEYMAARIAYVTPQIAGFDGDIAFAPNNSTPFDGSGCSCRLRWHGLRHAVIVHIGGGSGPLPQRTRSRSALPQFVRSGRPQRVRHLDDQRRRQQRHRREYLQGPEHRRRRRCP